MGIVSNRQLHRASAYLCQRERKINRELGQVDLVSPPFKKRAVRACKVTSAMRLDVYPGIGYVRHQTDSALRSP